MRKSFQMILYVYTEQNEEIS